jgi:hypothetical protein
MTCTRTQADHDVPALALSVHGALPGVVATVAAGHNEDPQAGQPGSYDTVEARSCDWDQPDVCPGF